MTLTIENKMKTVEQIEKLSEKLSIIRMWEAVKIDFFLPEKIENTNETEGDTKNKIKESICKELKDYINKRIKEIDENTIAIIQETEKFNPEDVSILKRLVEKVKIGFNTSAPIIPPLPKSTSSDNSDNTLTTTSAVPNGTGLISQIIDFNQKARKVATYQSKEVVVLAQSKDKITIQLSDGTKKIVPSKEITLKS